MLSAKRSVLIAGFLVFVTLLLLHSLAKHGVLFRIFNLAGSFHDMDECGKDIMNITLGFEKIFVINLPQRSDRRDAMSLAATFGDLGIEYVEGWTGHEVVDKVLPADSWNNHISGGDRGSWRAQMDALRLVVERNLSSALILEDDVDWDIRLKEQLWKFAQSSRAFTQPLLFDPSQTLVDISDTYKGGGLDIPMDKLPPSLTPKTSPYGDGWDVLWLGHCGASFPRGNAPASNSGTSNRPYTGSATTASTATSENADESAARVSLLKILIQNDRTVPQPNYLRSHPFAIPDALATAYPSHTRIVHAAGASSCSLAYAVSRQGARELLWQFGLQTLTSAWDFMLRDWCGGVYSYQQDEESERNDTNDKNGRLLRRVPVCVTVQPPLFSHHFGKGAASDIMAPGGGFVSKNKEMTPYVRLSVRMNMARLARGAGMRDMVDQYPD